jgi:hypothetical protein
MNKAYIDSLIKHNRTGKLLQYVNKNAYLLSMDNIYYIINNCMIYNTTSPVVIGIDILGRFGREISTYIGLYFTQISITNKCSYVIAKYLHLHYTCQPHYYFGNYDMTKYTLSHILSMYYQKTKLPNAYDSKYIFGSLSNSNYHDQCKLYTNDKCIEYLLTSEITLKYSFNDLINNNDWNNYIAPYMIDYFSSDVGACKYPRLYKKYSKNNQM